MNRRDLITVLKMTAGACAHGNPVPAFSSVFFTNDEAVVYDGQAYVSTPCALELGCGVEHRVLNTWLKGVTGDEVSVSIKDDDAIFKCGRAKLSIPTVESDLMPFKPESSDVVMVDHAPDLIDEIRGALPFAGDDSMPPGLQGVCLSQADGDLSVWASNSIVITHRSLAVGEGAFSLILPIDRARLVAQLASMVAPTTVSASSELFEAAFEDGTVLVSRVSSECSVDNYEQVMAGSVKKVKNTTRIPDDLRNAVKSVSAVLSAAGGDQVKLTVKDKVFTVETFNAGRAAAKESVDFDYADIELAVNAKYMMQLLDDGEKLGLSEGIVGVSSERSDTLLATIILKK